MSDGKGFNAHFSGDHLDGKSVNYGGSPPAILKTRNEAGEEIWYVRKNVEESWQPGGTIAFYDVHERHWPEIPVG